MTESEEGGPVTLGDVLARLRARWLIVVVVAVASGLGGVALAAVWPVSYSATALIQVSPITSTPFSATPASQQVSIETERNVLASPEVAADVIDRLGDPREPDEVLEQISVSSPPDSLVLRVTATGPDAQGAADLANAFSESYLELRSTRASALSDVLRQGLEDQIESLTSGELGDTSSELVQQQVLELRQEQARLAAVGVDPGTVIGRAAVPSGPSSLSPRIIVAAATALGILAGLLAALVVDAADPRVRRAARAAAVTGRPVVTARDDDDDEAMLQLVAALSPRLSDTSAPAPLMLALACPDQVTFDAARSLQEHLRRTGRRVALEELTDDEAVRVDRGYPDRDDLVPLQSDLVVLNLTALSSQARQAGVAARCDLLVLVATPRTPIAALRSWHAIAESSGTEVAPLLFVRRLRAPDREPVPSRPRHSRDDRLAEAAQPARDEPAAARVPGPRGRRDRPA